MPVIGYRNYQAAIDLAKVLPGTGEGKRADKSLNRSLTYIQSKQQLDVYGYGVSDVEIGVSAVKFATRSKNND